MKRKIKVYLAGQMNEYDNDWKEKFKVMSGFNFHDWEFDSDQTSPDTFFPDDLNGIKWADFMVANPGIAPSEATWAETGYFYSNNVRRPGDFCTKLIIIWKKDRNPKWSIEFIKKMGYVVNSVDLAKKKLKELAVNFK